MSNSGDKMSACTINPYFHIETYYILAVSGNNWGVWSKQIKVWRWF